MLRRYNPNKELKKIQGKGIYNRNFKLMIIGSVFALTALIAASFALWSFASDKNVAFNGKATKMLTIDVSAGSYASVGVFSAKILEDNEVRTETPDFSVGYPTSSSGSTLSGLYAAKDNDGTSYYFRGNKNNLNNNVNFAGKKWKILRINGDGSIRLILADNTIDSTTYNSTIGDIKYVGYTYDNTPCTNSNPCRSELNGTTFKNSNNGSNSEVKTALENWYLTNLKTYDNQIALSTYCNDTSLTTSSTGTTNFLINKRLSGNQPSLQCFDPIALDGTLNTYGGVYKLKIGLITADESVMAGYGGTYAADKSTANNFLYFSKAYWTMSPGRSTPLYDTYAMWFNCTNYFVSNTADVRELTKNLPLPVINLKPDVKVSGSGTTNDPYVVSNTYTTSNIKIPVKYNTDTRIKIYPKSGYALNIMDCNDEEGVFQNIKYDRETNEIIMNAQSDLTCMLDYKPNLKATIIANNPAQETEPDFSKGSPACDDYNCKNPTENGNGLFTTLDNEGTSYYFRGAVDNNNVKFSNLDWKIVRINGDGTIRLILKYSDYPLMGYFNNLPSYYGNMQNYVGYTYDNTSPCTQNSPCISNYSGSTFQKQGGMGEDSKAKISLESWYKTNLSSNDSKIALTTYCNDTSVTNEGGMNEVYGPKDRIQSYKPSLICPDPTAADKLTPRKFGGVYKLKIGLINADEMVMAGLNYTTSRNYLYNFGVMENPISMSPYEFWTDGIVNVYAATAKDIYGGTVDYNYSLVPVVNLKNDVEFSVNSGSNAGTTTNPYVIK